MFTAFRWSLVHKPPGANLSKRITSSKNHSLMAILVRVDRFLRGPR
jgi:hypothetical protein